MTYSAWRIVQEEWLESAFSGEGARLYGGRWNSEGTAVVYLAASLSLAALEMLIHIKNEQEFRARYVAIPVTFAAEDVLPLAVERLPFDWQATPFSSAARAYGDGWVKQQRSLLLRVPSVVIPQESNFLLNPQHPQFSKLEVGTPQPFSYDERLYKQ